MVVSFRCEGVERGNQYNLFTTEFKMEIEKEDALALIAELQRAIYLEDVGEEDGEG